MDVWKNQRFSRTQHKNYVSYMNVDGDRTKNSSKILIFKFQNYMCIRSDGCEKIYNSIHFTCTWHFVKLYETFRTNYVRIKKHIWYTVSVLGNLQEIDMENRFSFIKNMKTIFNSQFLEKRSRIVLQILVTLSKNKNVKMYVQVIHNSEHFPLLKNHSAN